MARDRTARTRIRNHLLTQGPVDDPSGHSTSVLKEAIGYEGSPVAFIQLVAAMDRDGEIVRDIRGKRTYRISPGQSLHPSTTAPTRAGLMATAVAGTGPGAGDTVGIDYDKLARALVRELWDFVAMRQPAEQMGAAASMTLEAERDRMLAERDEYAHRLELARTKLDELLGGPALAEATCEGAVSSA